MRQFKIVLSLLIAGALFGTALIPEAAYGQDKEFVFIAGNKDHGRPGRHEYEKDLRVLAYCLENSPNMNGITTKLFVGGKPADVNELSNATVIVIDGSSDRAEKEQHPIFPQDPSTNHRRYDAETTEYLKQLNAIIDKKKTGVVIFHYGLWAEHFQARSNYLNWIGGVWVQGPSKNPSGQWKIELENTDHPILRGVEPWEFREEIFYNAFRIDLDGPDRRTDLLIGHPMDVQWWGAKPDGPEVAAWAYERVDGGRGFAYGGFDFHDNIAIDNVRRFVLNGIVWAAGMEVPEGGVNSSVTDEIMQ